MEMRRFQGLGGSHRFRAQTQEQSVEGGQGGNPCVVGDHLLPDLQPEGQLCVSRRASQASSGHSPHGVEGQGTLWGYLYKGTDPVY